MEIVIKYLKEVIENSKERIIKAQNEWERGYEEGKADTTNFVMKLIETVGGTND